MNCSWPGSSAHGDSPGKDIGVGCHALLQGVFSTQESNLGLLHHRRILYQLSHKGSPDKEISKGAHSRVGDRTQDERNKRAGIDPRLGGNNDQQ